MTSAVLDAEQRLTALAEAVADGLLPDWDSAESDAADEAERVVVRHLRAIAAIGRLQTGLTFDTSLAWADATLGSLTANLEVPTTWGSLRVVERIGRGRFGDVYLAAHRACTWKWRSSCCVDTRTAGVWPTRRSSTRVD